MPWDAHGDDGPAEGSPGPLAAVSDALAKALPGGETNNAADEELTLDQRIEYAASKLKKLMEKRAEEADESKWPALDAEKEKLAATIAELEAQADKEAAEAAPAVASATKGDAAAAPDAAAAADAKTKAASLPVVQTATFGEFKEVWAHKGFTEDEVAEFHKGLQAMSWTDLQAKLQEKGTCKLINPSLIDYLQKKWGKTFEIQAGMLPKLLEQKPKQNVVFQQRAGTGKTVAFVINCITRCNPAVPGVQAVIVSPTVLLNKQTAEVVAELAAGTGIKVAAAIDKNDPAYALKAPIEEQILCATPGTVLGWCRASKGKRFIPHPEQIEVLTLDEADELIDDSNGDSNSMAKATFALRDVLIRRNPQLQLVLLSATFSESMQRQADMFVGPSRNPSIQLYKPAEDSVGMNVTEFAVMCANENDKLRAVEEILGGAKGVTTDMAVIFCATKRKVKEVCHQLQEGAGLDASNIAECHSDLTQGERIAVVKECKDGKKNFLVSTDILAKGIDIDRCNVVVNYDLPIRFEQGCGQNNPNSQPDFEKHLHRVGRAGRANKKGVAFHLVNAQEPWWISHLEATMHHWADKDLHWLRLDDDGDAWDKVEDEQDEDNPNRVASQ